MIAVSNNEALGTYGFDRAFDVVKKPEGVPGKATENSKINNAELNINERLRRQANDLSRISDGNQDRIYCAQNASNTNGVIVDLRLRINQLSSEMSGTRKISDREMLQSEIASIKTSLSNLLINSGEMIRMQANQSNEDVLALLTL